MGIRFSHVYNVLEYMEIDTDEQTVELSGKLVGKTFKLTPNVKHVLGRVMNNMYISQLNFRAINEKQVYNNPIRVYMNAVKECMLKTLNRTYQNASNSECPLDNLDYHQQYTLMAYQRANEIQIYLPDKNRIEEFKNYMEFEHGLNSRSKIRPAEYHTSILHIFLMTSPPSFVNGEAFCDAYKDHQLCLEYL